MKTFFRNILVRNTHRTLGLDGLRYDKFYINNLASQAIKVTKIPKPKGGFRNIYIYCLRDRIEAQNIFDFIELNHLDKFIYPKVFGVKNKPVFVAQQRITKWYKRVFKNKVTNKYFLKGDVKNFYDCMNKKICLDLIQKLQIFDSSQLAYIYSVIYKDVLENGKWMCYTKGLHTGLTLVNLFSNLYLKELDSGLDMLSKTYLRVGDDFFATFDSLDDLEMAKVFMQSCMQKLDLEYTYCFGDACSLEFDFLGYVYVEGRVLIRKSSLARVKRNISGRFKPVSGSLEYKKNLLVQKYSGDNGFDVYINSVLDAYRFMNCNKQAYYINDYLLRYLNNFLFGYKGDQNYAELKQLLKDLNIDTFYDKFWKLQSGRLKYSQLRKSPFRHVK